MIDLEEKKAARAADRARAWSDLQTKALELEDKYENELGPIGSEFAIVLPVNEAQVSDGIIIVKKPAKIAWNAFVDSDMKTTAKHHLSRGCIANMTPEEFDVLVGKRPQVVTRVSDAVCTLVGVDLKVEAGK